MLVAVGIALEAVDLAVDEDITRWAAGSGGRIGEVVSLALSRVGDVPGVVAALVVAVVVARSRDRWCDLSLVAVAGTVELVGFLVVSEVVGRDRPPVRSPDAAPFTGAYPSGHTAVALAVLGALALLVPRHLTALRRGALTAAVLGAVLVGAARVVRGQHRPSEVLAGLALGAAALAVTDRAAKRQGWSPQPVTQPIGTPDASERVRGPTDRVGPPPAVTRRAAPGPGRRRRTSR